MTRPSIYPPMIIRPTLLPISPIMAPLWVPRPARPSRDEVNVMLRFLLYGDDRMWAGFSPDLMPLAKELRSMAEFFIWQFRRLNSYEIASVTLPSRLPRVSEYHDYQRDCPRFLVDPLPQNNR